MEKFISNFIEKNSLITGGNLPVNYDLESELSVVKFLKKIIFKHDVMTEFKSTLKLIFSTEEYNVSNEVIKKLVLGLKEVLTLDIEDKKKVDVFLYVFQAFIQSCRRDENLVVLQFFGLLWFVSGLGVSKSKSGENDDGLVLINKKNFQNTFTIKISKPSSVSYEIGKELFTQLSKLSINLNTTEVQNYYKWLLQIVKYVATSESFQFYCVEIFSACVDIDFRLIETNIDHIYTNILSQTNFQDEKFCLSYEIFLEKVMKMCSRMQRTVKFVSKLLSVIKVTPTSLTPDVILPGNFFVEFSKVITTISTQQSLSLMETLVGFVDESSNALTSDETGTEKVLFEVSAEILISFLKDVKIYAPAISYATLQSFVKNLNLLLDSLRRFGTFILNNENYILKNENIMKSYLALCFYSTEVHIIVYCYKDTFVESVVTSITTDDCDWNCCLSMEQWNSLIKVISSSDLESCILLCVQLSLQRLRILKLENTTEAEDSTIKLILGHFYKPFILQKLTPEDITTFLEFLTAKQTKTMTKKLLKRILDKEADIMSWLSDSRLQESSSFTTNIFSSLLKEMGNIIGEGSTKVSWLSDDFFDANNNIDTDNVEKLPEKINTLLKNAKKVRKKALKGVEDKERIRRVVEVFRLLPLVDMDVGFRRLGLSFAVALCVLMSDDDMTVKHLFEKVMTFLACNIDPSVCFHIGLCIGWLSELDFESTHVHETKTRVIEELIKGCPNSKNGLSQIGELIKSLNSFDLTGFKLVETQVLLYQELGKCWQRARKRQFENDMIGNYRNNLTKIISEEAKKFDDSVINSENHRILFKIFSIELTKVVKAKEEKKEKKPEEKENKDEIQNKKRKKEGEEQEEEEQKSKKRKKKEDEQEIQDSVKKKIKNESKEQVEKNEDNKKKEKENETTIEDEDKEIEKLIKFKFTQYFEYAVNLLEKDFDEASSSFLSVVLHYFRQIRKFLPEGILFRIWKAVKPYGKANWQLFCYNASQEEFQLIMSDLFQSTKAFLSSSSKESSNYFEIWVSFVESSSNIKRKATLVHLQDIFRFLYESKIILIALPVSRKIYLIKFFCFCLSSKKVILTSQMLDTILDIMLECPNEMSLSNQDFHDLFVTEMEAASLVLLKQFTWNKNKIHLSFVYFKRMLENLTKRSDVALQLSNDEVFYLADCAFQLEKWVSFLVDQKKDFVRIAAYFVAALVSSVASVTIVPAIKIHLINCMNHFLSISDSHTVSYLLRVLKPGYQQVFNTIYNQFKKHHKYSGKV